MQWRAIWQTPKDAMYNFFMDNGLTLAAALAVYAILSIAPLLILLVTVTGLVSDSTGQQIIAQTEKLIGPQASQGVGLLVENAKAQRFAATTSAVTGLVILLLSATSAFGQLQSSLNAVFNVRWGDTWVGGIITGLLFVGGEYAISEYLRSSGTTTVYGAAGALVILLLWIYYSSIILFLGAELTQAYAKCCGHESGPDEPAEWDPETALRLHQKEEQAEEVHAGAET